VIQGPVVVDSSCFISLERIGRLELLPALFDPVVATPEVSREFGASPAWLSVATPSNSPLVAAVSLLVDSGEAEAIALAQERGWRIILDDQRARSVAARPGASCDWHHRRPAASQAGRSHRFTPPPLG